MFRKITVLVTNEKERPGVMPSFRRSDKDWPKSSIRGVGRGQKL